ncbi:MAG: hypothetical protein ASARMPREDX12_007597 [Alectoria sarmentosa]|nr:MAG: hypothetical protein ASARMPREDX12_007597 [Alectoria sarmentosa]
MDPQAPSQPSIDTAYENPDNPADQTPSESKNATSIGASQQRSDPTYERRELNDTVGDRGSASQSEAMPSSLGYGAQDSGGDAGESMGGPVSNQEGEQMSAAGDGDIAVAQERKHGFGEQTSLTSDLDRKKAEQAEIKDGRSNGGGGGGGVDVQGALGGGNKGFVGGKGETGQDSEGGGMQSSHADV